MRNIQPRGEYVLIDPLPSTPRGASVNAEAGRIILADVAEEPSRTGKVIAVGPGRWVPGEWWYHDGETYNRFYDFRNEGYYWIPGYLATPEVAPGDTVLIPRYAGVEFIRGEDAEEFVGLRLMKESDIIMKIARN